MRCSSCNTNKYEESKVIVGLCEPCAATVIREGRKRDWYPTEPWPGWEERVIHGVNLWWWRGTWRASRPAA